MTPGSGATSRWHLNYTVCDSCYQQRNKGLSCPLCGRAYRQFTDVPMVQCTNCEKCVHIECDDAAQDMAPYKCTNCRMLFEDEVSFLLLSITLRMEIDIHCFWLQRFDWNYFKARGEKKNIQCFFQHQ